MRARPVPNLIQYFRRPPALAQLLAALVLSFAFCARAQDSPAPITADQLPNAPNPQAPGQDDVTVRNLPRNFLRDQAAIWASPKDIRAHDLVWLIPLAAATGVALGTDHYVMTHVVSTHPGFNQDNINASNAMVYSLVAAPVAIYGFGRIGQDDHAREAGILAGEAMVDGVVVEQGLKLVFWRERPDQDQARGRFFQSNAGVDSALPSSHTLIAFSAASALAAEYPSRWTQILLYTGATGVGITRVLGREHFPADVLVGGACGWLIGRYVVRKHHKIRLE
jgi:membrane-associated phospholipid phosphatase